MTLERHGHIVPLDARALIDSGVLHRLNALALWPIGLALSVSLADGSLALVVAPDGFFSLPSDLGAEREKAFTETLRELAALFPEWDEARRRLLPPEPNIQMDHMSV